jgi:hypothetical protein
MQRGLDGGSASSSPGEEVEQETTTSPPAALIFVGRERGPTDNEYISALVIQWRRIFCLRHEENGSGGRYAGRISVQPAMADTTIDGSEDPNFVPSFGLEIVRLGENLLELALTWIPTTVYQ